VTLTRAALQAALREALRGDAAVDAAWEGGSAAFGRDDALSDIDAVAVVAPDAVDAVFARCETALAALSPVALRLDMPPQPGYAQKFYRLRDAGEFLIIDLVLLRRGEALLFREVELHGRGTTWFDRSGVLAEERHLDMAADQAAARERVPLLLAQFEMFQHLVSKEIARGHGSDALAFYQAWTLRPLAEALRLLHAPHTRVFGLRYLARDLPAATVQRLEALAFVGSLAQLQAAHAQARQWFADCAKRLRALGPGAGLAPDPGSRSG
jgi:predicted nucleotidyltransferase